MKVKKFSLDPDSTVSLEESITVMKIVFDLPQIHPNIASQTVPKFHALTSLHSLHYVCCSNTLECNYQDVTPYSD